MALEVTIRAERPIPLDVAFRVAPGELLALVGPSGAGKSTVLRAIAGLLRPASGRIAVAGRPWLDTASGVDRAAHRRRVGVVFQHYALFPHMTAAANVMAAMERADPAEARRLLALTGLDGLGGRHPGSLSGGQQQRVALARAIARRPEVLLLDEPFSAVDRATRERLHDQVLALRRHLPMPIVLVTHDAGEAQLLADRMAVIEAGRLVATGTTAEVMAQTAALRAMGLREAAAMLPATVAAHLPDGLTRLDTSAGTLVLPGLDAPAGTQLRVRIMAHEVILSRTRPEGLSAQNILPGRVLRLTPGDGPGMMVHVALGGHEILARITRRAADQMALGPGDEVHAILKTMSVARDHVAAGGSGQSGA